MTTVTYWKRFDPASAVKVGPVERPSKKTCVAPLEIPAVLQTPAFELLAPLLDEHGVALPAVHARPLDPDFLKVIEASEHEVREQCVARKKDWLRRDADEDEVRQAFKSFVKDGAIKLSVPDDCEFFDLSKNACERGDVGTHARAIIEMGRVVFGKTEFGAVWRIRQMQSAQAKVASPPQCMIESDDEGDSESSDDDDADLNEFD